jgi:hypothetical protein
MAPRLKVFVTSDGLTDYIVATTSKAKALAAWGSHQDLFKTGHARQTDDPALVKAASQQPGEVLRRPAGTRGQLATFTAPKTRRAAKPAGPSKAAVRKVAGLEQKLQKLDDEHRRSLAKLEAERRALETRQESLEAGHAAERARYEAALTAARRALE